MTTFFSSAQFFSSQPVMLAPMAGVNDPVFRSTCKQMGAALTYTEMISAKGLSYHNKKTDEMLNFLDDEPPFAVQLFGNEPAILAAMAAELEERLQEKLALIDINMGCPARKVAHKGNGVALMRTPELAEKIIRAVVAATKKPVTVKFRKGFEYDEDTAVVFARMAEGAGVSALAVHGRCAQQYYKGSADRSVIDRVSKAVSIPVLASGDVYTHKDIEDYFARGAAGVLVARGACGNPWIFAGFDKTRVYDTENRTLLHQGYPPSLGERVRVAWNHTQELYALNPAKLVSMRRHVAWYFKGTPHAAAIRRTLGDCVTLEDYKALFDAVLAW